MMAWVVVSLTMHQAVAFTNLKVADGFFDAGMLLQALKASQEEKDRPRERGIVRRSVGKKLRLSDY